MIYDKLKPHIKAKMKENAEEYESVNWLLDKLKNKENYSDLTIEQDKIYLYVWRCMVL